MFLYNPVLLVDGKELKVNSVFYREGKIHSVSVFDNSGNPKQYHDSSENTAYYIEKPLQVDFKKALKFEGQYNDILDILYEIICSNEREMIGCAIGYIDTDDKELKEKYSKKIAEQMAVFKIKDIIDDLTY